MSSSRVGVDLGALGDGPAAGVDKVLAEVLGREVRERARAAPPTRVTRAAPPSRAVCSILRIRSAISACSCIESLRPPSCSRSPSTASATVSTAASHRARVSPSPAAKLARPRCRRRARGRGSRPSARASSIASASAEGVGRGAEDARRASASSLASKRWIVPGRGAGRHRVDEQHHARRPAQASSSAVGSPLAGHDLHAGRQRGRAALGDVRARRRRRARQRLPTPTTTALALIVARPRASRKCVAQEMHGS